MSTAFSSDIAIVGLSCRFPGASNKQMFWSNLVNGVDSVIETPSYKWNHAAFFSENLEKKGSIHSKYGGFLEEEHLSQFDNEFFGMTARESNVIDPQQKILLELTMEAIQDSGNVFDSTQSKQYGVFIGIGQVDYNIAQMNQLDKIDTYTQTGMAHSIASNRISNFFNFTGPSMSIDTACSSSLYALHLAVNSMNLGECSGAVVGGVNLMLHPSTTISFSKLGVLSMNGKCHTFDASADGYVRSEGAGIVILKRLDDAIRDGNHVYGVVKGSGVNEDGGNKQSLTTPSEHAQFANLIETYQRSGIDSGKVCYVEAHGTGTPKGDVTEAASIGRFFSQEDRSQSLFIGSVKSNIGHLECASGMAGLLKVLLMIKNRTMVPSIHFNTPNPGIDFDGLNIKVITQVQPIDQEEPILMGVNSFGFGGANAHCIIQEYKQVSESKSQVKTGDSKTKPVFFPISAKNPKSFQGIAQDLIQHTISGDVSKDELFLGKLSLALMNHRNHYKYRCGLVASDVKSLTEQLEQVAKRNSKDFKPIKSEKKLAFVFSGQGPQWRGMGTQLIKESPIYRECVEECDGLFKKISGWSLLEKWESLTDDEFHEPQYAQPALFILQVGLLKVWKQMGVIPDAIVGHSMGEVTSFFAAGVLSLEQAIRVIYVRSHLQQETCGLGNMLAVGLSKEEVQEKIINRYPGVEIASINSPNSVALASNKETLEQVSVYLNEQQVFNRLLKGSCGFHSSLQDSIKDQVLQELDIIEYREPHTTLYSTVSGSKFKLQSMFLDNGTNYWWKNIRETVNFQGAIQEMINDGYDCFLEVGPHPVLVSSISECNASLLPTEEEDHIDLLCINTLKRGVDENESLLSALSQLYTYGVNVKYSPNDNSLKWDTLSSLNLPTYHWNRSSGVDLKISNIANYSKDVLFCGTKDITSPFTVYKSFISIDRFPFLSSHIVQGSLIAPGAGFVIMAIQTVLKEFQYNDNENFTGSVIVENSKFINSLGVDGEDKFNVSEVQISLTTESTKEERQTVNIQSQLKKKWELNAHMDVCIKKHNSQSTIPNIDLEAIRKRCNNHLTKSETYNKLQVAGFELGLEFKGIEQMYTGEGEVLCELGRISTNNSALGVDVVYLDAIFQSFFGTVEYDNVYFLPIGFDKMVLHRHHHHSPRLFSHCKLLPGASRSLVKGDITVVDEEGRVYANLYGLSAQGFPHNGQKHIAQCFNIQMKEIEVPPPQNVVNNGENLIDNSNNRVIVFNSENSFDLASQLAAHFKNVVLVDSNEEIKEFLTGDKLICLQGLDEDENYSACRQILNLVKSTTTTTLSSAIPLWIVTKGATNCSQGNVVFNNASLTGLGRTIRSEAVKSVTAYNVDISSEFEKDNLVECAKKLANLIMTTTPIEPELTLSTQGIFVPRLCEQVEIQILNDSKPPSNLAQPIVSLQLQSNSPGLVSDIVFKPSHLPHELGDDEVEIVPHAVGLNFKDIMFAIGTLPLNAFRKGSRTNPPFGVDCAGVISRLGRNVSEFKIGDEVIAISRGSLASKVITNRYLVVNKPENMSMIEASTIPIVFVTAYMALVYLSRVEKDETCLIHSATGGVGLAAIMVAQNVCQAKVLATAGSQQKREYLSQHFGLTNVMNSRTLEFAEETIEQTQGNGVDMVLNTLDGEAIDKNLSILSNCGRFIEIGVKDIYNNRKIGLLPFHKNVSYHALDVDRLVDDRPELINRMLKEVVALMNKKLLSPLPTKVYSCEQIGEAFTFLSQSNQIGKVVIDMTQIISNPKNNSNPFEVNGTYLVTGGLGGVGLALSQWLVEEQGVKHIVLVGRSQPAGLTKQIICKMSEKANVRVELLDLANLDKVKNLIKTIQLEMPSLHSIFHLAATYDNVPISDMTSDLFQQVMKSKAVSAQNLHLASIDLPLKQFFMFSSISAMLGNQEQSAYASANTMLDALAIHRNNMGLPAVSVGFAPISGIGFVAKNYTIRHILRYRGLLSLPLNSLFQSIMTLYPKNGHFILAGIDWEKLSLTFPHLKHFLNKHFVEARVLSAEVNYRELILEQVGKSVGVSPANVLESYDHSLKDFGLDSITSIQLKNWVDSTFGPRLITQMELLQGMTPRKLEERLSKVKPSEIKVKSSSSVPSSSKKSTTVTTNPETTQNNSTMSTGSEKQESRNQKTASSQHVDKKHPFIFGIGTANPPPFLQSEIGKAISKEYDVLYPEHDTKIMELYDNTSIHQRHLCYDVTKNSVSGLRKEGTYNAIYKQVAPELALESSKKAIAQWGGKLSDITHVVSCSCTGVCVPDINFLLIEKLGLSSSVQRVSVNFMGCFGGLSTLRTAQALSCVNSKNRVLMVCTELSSIHYDISLKQDIKIGSAIFADGSGAMIVGCEPTPSEEPLFEVLQAATIAVPNTIEMMEWELGPKGWSLGLSPEIPAVIYREMPNFVHQTMLQFKGEKITDISNVDWVLHSGGKAILNAIEVSLELQRERTVSGWNILHNYGNMSSCTVLFVMEDLVKRDCVDAKEFVIGMAFGPGLSVEGVLMRNARYNKQIQNH